MTTITKDQITGIILAGGLGFRMGNVNKGLQCLHGEAMIKPILRTLSAQVATMMINANQDLMEYAQFDIPLFSDIYPDYAGPLAGIHVGLKNCHTEYLLCAPCDAPFLPTNLASQLAINLEQQQADVAIAYTKENNHIQYHPVFCLMKSSLCEHLEKFIQQGGRKVSAWHATLKVADTFFKDNANFQNINDLKELSTANTTIIRSSL